MKPLFSSTVRAICAITIGVLLVKYRDGALTWLTIAIGALFFISGTLSICSYLASRRKSASDDFDIYDAQGSLIVQSRPMFPVVGVGSLLLGIVLMIMPNTFVNGLVIALALILILGAISQMANLFVARQFAPIGAGWWVVPVLILLLGIVALVKPSLIATAPLLIIGWALMIYGVIDFINSFKLSLCRRAFKKAASATAAAEAAKKQEEASGEGMGAGEEA